MFNKYYDENKGEVANLIYSDIPKLPKVKKMVLAELLNTVETKDANQLFYVTELLYRQVNTGCISLKTGIDLNYLESLDMLIRLEKSIVGIDIRNISKEKLDLLHHNGFTDKDIGVFCLFATEEDVRKKRLRLAQDKTYIMLDAFDPEAKAFSTYYYSSYEKICAVDCY